MQVSIPKALFCQLGLVLHWDDLNSVFMAVGDADTFWHPQFFSTVTFESQRLVCDTWLARMTAYSKVMVELASLVIQHFVSHHVQLSFGRETLAHWCWLWRPVRIRTLKTQLGVSWRRLSTSSSTR